MKQYLPKKPIKRGFKVWVRAESISGYFADFDVYVGKDESAAAASDVELGLGEKVVIHLARTLEQHNYMLFYDNYFSTCRLSKILLQQNVYSCGTARQDRRDFPKELRGLRLQQGEFEFRQQGNVVATVWRDKRDVVMISSMHTATTTTTVERKQRDGSRINVTCPQAVASYNKYMSGVDKGDQLRNYYRVRLKSSKYYKYIFWFLFDVAVTNSYILANYRVTTTSINTNTLKSFRLNLSSSLIGDYSSKKRIGRPRSMTHISPALPLPDSGGPPPARLHLPSHSHGKRCVYCQKYRQPPRRRQSVWECSECPGEPALCLTGRRDGSCCFSIWHSSLTN